MVSRRQRVRSVFFSAYAFIVGVLLAEAALRLVQYHFSPIVFIPPDNVDDHRPYHMGGRDLRIRTRSLTVPDPALLWRPDPDASHELTAEGFRGGPVRSKDSSSRLIVALGDSNTLGPLDSAAHWPGFLEDLVNANSPTVRYQVVNAGVYGYSTYQGLRRYEQIRLYRPDIVYFCFGANDAQPVETTDEGYAARVQAMQKWAVFRLGPPALHIAWRVADVLRSTRTKTYRVPLADYRENLERFVRDARGSGIVPILMTRPFVGVSDDSNSLLRYLPAYNETVRSVATDFGVPLLDGFAVLANRNDLFVDPIHNNRIGYRLLAEAALRQLRSLGYVPTDNGVNLNSVLDLASATDRRLELGVGFWSLEAWSGSAGGRWTQAEASVELGRADDERVLLVDLSCLRPKGPTIGVVEVNGRIAAHLPTPNGRHRLWIALNESVGRRVDVRFVVRSAYCPRDLDPRSADSRVLGVFLHEVRLERRAPGEDWQVEGALRP